MKIKNENLIKTMKVGWLVVILSLISSLNTACSEDTQVQTIKSGSHSEFYSTESEEIEVNFQASYKMNASNMEDVIDNKDYLERYTLPEVVKFLFGPLTLRELGGMQKNSLIQIDTKSITISKGEASLNYNYSGKWLVHSSLLNNKTLQLPLPYNIDALRTKNWSKCSDNSPGHQDWSFFWYFWDPTRYGCDHQLNKEYQNIQVEFKAKTAQTLKSFPEYNRMIQNKQNQKVLTMTFAFGYVEDSLTPDPYKDTDAGMYEFQKFNKRLKQLLKLYKVEQSPIMGSEYSDDANTAKIKLGTLYSFSSNEITFKIRVVAAANVDQMELFAKSFSIDHEAFFGWFGHSRVGSGFDADNFNQMLMYQPNKYTLTNEYQLIYWAGCNSYSYYTLPFFKLKGGSKNLDIISNGLPSFFSFNSTNAEILADALIHFDQPQSYQDIVTKIENNADQNSTNVLVNVLGDEDNQN